MLNSTSLSFSKLACALSERRTSNSEPEIGLALTLTLMLIPGALSRPRSDCGAPGLSNDKSFTYCVRMLSVAGWAAALSLPFPACAVPLPLFSDSVLAIVRFPCLWPRRSLPDFGGSLAWPHPQDKFPGTLYSGSSFRLSQGEDGLGLDE